MARRRIVTVQIQTNDQLIEIRWKTSQQLRGRLLGAGVHSAEKKFADKGTVPRSSSSQRRKSTYSARFALVCRHLVMRRRVSYFRSGTRSKLT